MVVSFIQLHLALVVTQYRALKNQMNSSKTLVILTCCKNEKKRGNSDITLRVSFFKKQILKKDGILLKLFK